MSDEAMDPSAGDALPAKPLSQPSRPTPEMAQARDVSHIPFRSRRPHCVQGRGRCFYHRKADHASDDSALPVVSIDYGFLGAPGEPPQNAVGGQKKMPVLVARDRVAKAICAHLVPCKGVEPFAPRSSIGSRYQVSWLHQIHCEIKPRTCHFGTCKRSQEHSCTTEY